MEPVKMILDETGETAEHRHDDRVTEIENAIRSCHERMAQALTEALVSNAVDGTRLVENIGNRHFESIDIQLACAARHLAETEAFEERLAALQMVFDNL